MRRPAPVWTPSQAADDFEATLLLLLHKREGLCHETYLRVLR